MATEEEFALGVLVADLKKRVTELETDLAVARAELARTRSELEVYRPPPVPPVVEGPKPRFYYFGPRSPVGGFHSGHVWYANEHHVLDPRNPYSHEPYDCPWQTPDQKLCRGYVKGGYMSYEDSKRWQVEGLARLHHEKGWTAISYWDRSCDTRGGCNSTFAGPGTYTFEEMLALAKRYFPDVIARASFAVTLEVVPATSP